MFAGEGNLRRALGAVEHQARAFARANEVRRFRPFRRKGAQRQEEQKDHQYKSAHGMIPFVALPLLYPIRLFIATFAGLWYNGMKQFFQAYPFTGDDFDE